MACCIKRQGWLTLAAQLLYACKDSVPPPSVLAEGSQWPRPMGHNSLGPSWLVYSNREISLDPNWLVYSNREISNVFYHYGGIYFPYVYHQFPYCNTLKFTSETIHSSYTIFGVKKN